MSTTKIETTTKKNSDKSSPMPVVKTENLFPTTEVKTMNTQELKINLNTQLENLDKSKAKKTGLEWLDADKDSSLVSHIKTTLAKIRDLEFLVSLESPKTNEKIHDLEKTIKTRLDDMETKITTGTQAHFESKAKNMHKSILNKKAGFDLLNKHGSLAGFASPIETIAENRSERRALESLAVPLFVSGIDSRDGDSIKAIDAENKAYLVALIKKGKSVKAEVSPITE